MTAFRLTVEDGKWVVHTAAKPQAGLEYEFDVEPLTISSKPWLTALDIRAGERWEARDIHKPRYVTVFGFPGANKVRFTDDRDTDKVGAVYALPMAEFIKRYRPVE
jgi:hypothetical protein